MGKLCVKIVVTREEWSASEKINNSQITHKEAFSAHGNEKLRLDVVPHSFPGFAGLCYVLLVWTNCLKTLYGFAQSEYCGSTGQVASRDHEAFDSRK